MSASAPRRPGLLDAGRTLLTLGAILPGLGAGLVTLAATGNRRRGWNRALALWGELGTRAAGIRLDVRGQRHLALRPAVFLLNHQSGIDPILACALLRRDFVGVAKRELRRNPVLGPAFAFAGSVFLDRDDTAQAREALQPAVETLRRGLAVAIAPEGTRSRDGALGPFKKGAFRLALAARAPLVPIVIHNARDVLPRHAWIMTPATVRVVVHPPIPTEAWRPEELDARIAQIEALYRATLAAGPAGGVSSPQQEEP